MYKNYIEILKNKSSVEERYYSLKCRFERTERNLDVSQPFYSNEISTELLGVENDDTFLQHTLEFPELLLELLQYTYNGTNYFVIHCINAINSQKETLLHSLVARFNECVESNDLANKTAYFNVIHYMLTILSEQINFFAYNANCLTVAESFIECINAGRTLTEEQLTLLELFAENYVFLNASIPLKESEAINRKLAGMSSIIGFHPLFNGTTEVDIPEENDSKFQKRIESCLHNFLPSSDPFQFTTFYRLLEKYKGDKDLPILARFAPSVTKQVLLNELTHISDNIANLKICLSSGVTNINSYYKIMGAISCGLSFGTLISGAVTTAVSFNAEKNFIPAGYHSVGDYGFQCFDYNYDPITCGFEKFSSASGEFRIFLAVAGGIVTLAFLCATIANTAFACSSNEPRRVFKQAHADELSTLNNIISWFNKCDYKKLIDMGEITKLNISSFDLVLSTLDELINGLNRIKAKIEQTPIKNEDNVPALNLENYPIKFFQPVKNPNKREIVLGESTRLLPV